MLAGWWRLDGDTQDHSGYGHDPSGAATYVDGKFGQAIDSNPTDQLAVPITPEMERVFSGEELTVSFWVREYAHTETVRWRDWIAYKDTDGNHRRIERGYADSDPSTSDYWANIGLQTQSNSASNAGVPAGEWFHLTVRRLPDEHTVWINGEKHNSRTPTGPITPIDPNEFLIVNYDDTGSELHDVRFYTEGLSDAAIQDLAAAKVGHWKLNGSATDCSGYASHGSETGASVAPSAVNQHALEWAGAGGLTVSNASHLQLDGDVTISMWLYPTDIAAARQNPIDKAYGGEFTFTQETDGRINGYHGGAGDEASPYISSSTPGGSLTDNEWVHLVYTRDVSERTVEWYLDGSPSNSSTWTVENWVAPSASADDLLIASGYTNSYNGRIADVRLYATHADQSFAEHLYEQRASLTNTGSLQTRELVETPLRRGAEAARYLLVSGGYDIAAHDDDTTVRRNGDVVTTLNAGETFTGGSAPGDLLTADKPLVMGRTDGGVPVSWMGERFAWRTDRYEPITLHLYAPVAPATVEAYDCSVSTSTPDQTVSLTQGEYATLTAPTLAEWILEADVPICAFAQPSGDYRPLYPATTERFGVPSGSSHLVALDDNTTVTEYRSDGSTKTHSLARGEYANVSGSGSQFAGESTRLVADKPIQAASQGDADGGDMAVYTDREAMATEFVLPVAAEFVVFVGLDPTATVDVYDATGAYVDTKTVAGGVGEDVPTNLRIHDDEEPYTPGAGYRFVSSSPQWAVFENDGNQDETIFHGASPDGQFYGPHTSALPTRQGVVRVGEAVEAGADSGMEVGPATQNVLADGALHTGALRPPYASANRGSLAVVTEPSRFGRNALRHEATGDDSYTQPYSGAPNSLAPAQPGETWTASAYVRADAATPSVDTEVFVFALDASYNVIQNSAQSFTATTEWGRNAETNTMPANTEYVSMRIDNDGGAGAVVYWDGLQLEQSAAPTAFAEGDLRVRTTISEVA